MKIEPYYAMDLVAFPGLYAVKIGCFEPKAVHAQEDGEAVWKALESSPARSVVQSEGLELRWINGTTARSVRTWRPGIGRHFLVSVSRIDFVENHYTDYYKVRVSKFIFMPAEKTNLDQVVPQPEGFESIPVGIPENPDRDQGEAHAEELFEYLYDEIWRRDKARTIDDMENFRNTAHAFYARKELSLNLYAELLRIIHIRTVEVHRDPDYHLLLKQECSGRGD